MPVGIFVYVPNIGDRPLDNNAIFLSDYEWNPSFRYRRIYGRHLLIDISSSYRILEISQSLASLVEECGEAPFAMVAEVFLASAEGAMSYTPTLLISILVKHGIILHHAHSQNTI